MTAEAKQMVSDAVRTIYASTDRSCRISLIHMDEDDVKTIIEALADKDISVLEIKVWYEIHRFFTPAERARGASALSIDPFYDGVRAFFYENRTVEHITIIMPNIFTVNHLLNIFLWGINRYSGIKSYTLDLECLSIRMLSSIIKNLKDNGSLNSLAIRSYIPYGVEDEYSKLFIEGLRENTTLYELKLERKNELDDSVEAVELSDELMEMLSANAPLIKSTCKR